MSPRDPPVPPTGEEVHVAGPSILPFLTAIGITFTVIGITITWFLTIVGGLLTIACLIRWIRDARRDADELPHG